MGAGSVGQLANSHRVWSEDPAALMQNEGYAAGPQQKRVCYLILFTGDRLGGEGSNTTHDL